MVLVVLVVVLLVVLVLALVLALVLVLVVLVAVVVAPLLADARGRKPPRLATRAGENKTSDEGGGGGAVCGGIRAFLLLFMPKTITKLFLTIPTPLPSCSGFWPLCAKI